MGVQRLNYFILNVAILAPEEMQDDNHDMLTSAELQEMIEDVDFCGISLVLGLSFGWYFWI